MSVAHQFLFGYDDGHRLLAGSRELPAQTLLALLGASDAAMEAQSAPLLTGVALPDTHEYAFCVTWPAPEMPRAGAVWGHVLIVDANDLNDVGHHAALLALPRRPAGPPADLSGYSAPVQLAPGGSQMRERLAPRDHDRGVLEQIVRATYASRERTVCIHDDMHSATRAVLAVWAGQSPQLRRQFSFRTRQVIREERSNFDLTVAAKIRGSGDYPPGAVPSSTPEWVSVLVNDLLAPGPTPLREFLWTYGADSADRLAVRRIAKLWVHVAAGDASLARAQIERHWPDPRSGVELKHALFGNAQNRWWQVDDRTRVRALLETSSKAWNRGDLELKHRARALGIT